MGFIKDIFNGGKGAEQAALDRPFNPGQVKDQYNQANSLLNQQGDFVNALAAQNGIANQSSVFNQLQNTANGVGPNPALAQLAQATNANTANQAALMAGQRGSSVNPALIARLAAQQGAANQQNAAGQAATLQAQQSLNAQGQMANVAGQQVQNQGNAIMGQNQLAQGILNTTAGGINNQNQNALQNTQMANQVNMQNQNMQTQLLGGLANAAGPAIGMMFGGPAGAAAGSTIAGGSKMGQSMSAGMANGGVVPGKAKVAGDSPVNDTVSAQLSPGEVVIPRSIMESKDPASAAAAFVQGVMHSSKKKVDSAYFNGGMVVDPMDEEGSGNKLTMQQEELPITIGINPQQAAMRNEATRTGVTVPELQMMQQEGLAPETLESITEPGRQFVPAFNAPSDAPQASNAVLPQSASDNMPNALSDMQNGINAEARAQGQLGQQQAEILKRQQMDQKKLVADYTAQTSNLAAKREALIADINTNKINPNKFVQDMGASGRVATAIGFLLSGIGSGLTGKENLAMSVLNKQIDQDINAQQANLTSKHNLLAENLREYGNMRDAMAVTKGMQADIYANQMQQAAAKMSDPIAKAQAMQKAAELQMKYAPAMDAAAKRQALMQTIASGGNLPLAEVARSVVDEKDRDNVMKELGSFDQSSRARGNALKILDEVAKRQTLKERVGRPFDSAAEIGALNVGIFAALKPIFGVLSETDKKDVEKQFIGFMNSAKTIQDKKTSLDNFLKANTAGTPTLDSYPALRMLKERQYNSAAGATSVQKNENASASYKRK